FPQFALLEANRPLCRTGDAQEYLMDIVPLHVRSRPEADVPRCPALKPNMALTSSPNDRLRSADPRSRQADTVANPPFIDVRPCLPSGHRTTTPRPRGRWAIGRRRTVRADHCGSRT